MVDGLRVLLWNAVLLQSVQRKRVLLAERFRPQVPGEFTPRENPGMGKWPLIRPISACGVAKFVFCLDCDEIREDLCARYVPGRDRVGAHICAIGCQAPTAFSLIADNVEIRACIAASSVKTVFGPAMNSSVNGDE
jgi:hypothetical protein